MSRVVSLVRVVVCMCAMLAAGGVSARASSISALATPTSIAVGSQFTVDVIVGGVTDLYDYQFDLGFDASLLQLVSYVDGGFLTSGGETSAFGGPFAFVFDNTTGAFSVADLLLGPVSGVSGTGTLISMTFSAIAAGTSSITLTNIILEDSIGGSIAATVSGARVVVNQGTGTPPVPEPASLLLVAIPLVFMVGKRFRATAP